RKKLPLELRVLADVRRDHLSNLFRLQQQSESQSSTPALFETHVRLFTPDFTSALIRFSGMPQRPKPPTTSVDPSAMSFTASSAERTTLSIMARHITKREHARQLHKRMRTNGGATCPIRTIATRGIGVTFQAANSAGRMSATVASAAVADTTITRAIAASAAADRVTTTRATRSLR